MKNNKFSQNQTEKTSDGTCPPATSVSIKDATDFTPSADEVARRAYFAFENEGSKPGRDVQHWLAAEAELIAERNLTRVHGFHNQT